jgi:hypothetical protein
LVVAVEGAGGDVAFIVLEGVEEGFGFFARFGAGVLFIELAASGVGAVLGVGLVF